MSKPLTPTEHAYALARLLDAPLEWQRYQAWQDSLGANTSEHEANAERMQSEPKRNEANTERMPSEPVSLEAKAERTQSAPSENERIWKCAVCGYTARSSRGINGHGLRHRKGKK